MIARPRQGNYARDQDSHFERAKDHTQQEVPGKGRLAYYWSDGTRRDEERDQLLFEPFGPSFRNVVLLGRLPRESKGFATMLATAHVDVTYLLLLLLLLLEDTLV